MSSGRSNVPPQLDLNLGPSIRSVSGSRISTGTHVQTPPRAASAGILHDEPEDYDLTPQHPTFQRQGDFLSQGPVPIHGRGPSIDEPNAYLPTQSSVQSLSNAASSQDAYGQYSMPDYSSAYTQPQPLRRTYTQESNHSDSPLTTPAMESQAMFKSSGSSNNKPVKEVDYGATPPGSRSRSRSGTLGTSNLNPANLAINHAQTKNAYPPGQYQTIPLSGSASPFEGESERLNPNLEHSEKVEKSKKGIAWGGANRWSRNGTKEEAIELDKQGETPLPHSSVSSRHGSRPSSMFRGTLGSLGGGMGTGTSTPRSEWEGFEFNTAQAKNQDLRYAEGDMGKSKFAKGYFYLLNKSIITRWFLYIVPILVLLWVPGIVYLAGVKSAKIWTTNLLWWSIWFTVIWAGWWAALAAAMIFPRVVRATLVAIVPSLRFWVDILRSLNRNVAFIVWALVVWVSFTPLVINHFTGDATGTDSSSRSNLTLLANLLFGVFLCSLIIGAEKALVQLIAYRFHQDSYEDRIRDQKLQIRGLVTLYINSTDIPGRRDTLTEADMLRKKKDPKKHLKKALKGIKTAAQTTTSALGNVATEISGQSVLQTNSPYNRVTVALASASKSKALARRLYYSFRRDGADVVYLHDIARFFPDEESAEVAFAVFDRDDNGDATRDEFDMAVIQMHREKLALEASMRDLDGAVRRLDDIFMVIVLVIIVLVMAAMVTTKLTTLVTSAGTFILGLSWLIGTTMQEILGACIFLFVKHPFDVGDRVDFDGASYVVASMQLMSTTLRRTDGSYTYIGNDILRAKLITNIRRSGPISESFSFDVDFATDFKKLVSLRDKMLIFLHENRRDFMPIFDVVVDSFPEQGKLVLKSDIKYKTNWQEGALKVQRRNKWICALKSGLADCKIYGPAGAGDPNPDPADPIAYTMVPYEAPAPVAAGHPESPPPDFLAATQGAEHGAALLDQRQVVNDSSGDIFDDSLELDETNAASAPHSANTEFNPVRQRGAARVHGEDLEPRQYHRH